MLTETAEKQKQQNMTFSNSSTNARQRVFETVGQMVGPCPLKSTVIIAGTGRSGSTWLAEILRGLRGYKYLNEPFMDTPLAYIQG